MQQPNRSGASLSQELPLLGARGEHAKNPKTGWRATAPSSAFPAVGELHFLRTSDYASLAVGGNRALAKLHVGTSGWAYPNWKPTFYPEKLAQKKFLSYYATQLNAVEVNYTFRHMASAKTLDNWINETPSG